MIKLHKTTFYSTRLFLLCQNDSHSFYKLRLLSDHLHFQHFKIEHYNILDELQKHRVWIEPQEKIMMKLRTGTSKTKMNQQLNEVPLSQISHRVWALTSGWDNNAFGRNPNLLKSGMTTSLAYLRDINLKIICKKLIWLVYPDNLIVDHFVFIITKFQLILKNSMKASFWCS